MNAYRTGGNFQTGCVYFALLCTAFRSDKPNSTKEDNIVKTVFDKEATTACKYLVVENWGFVVDNHDNKYDMPDMNPMTPP